MLRDLWLFVHIGMTIKTMYIYMYVYFMYIRLYVILYASRVISRVHASEPILSLYHTFIRRSIYGVVIGSLNLL